MKKKSKKTIINCLVAFILGGVIFGGITTVIAASIASLNVSYSNTSSGTSATNVQGALDELYMIANGQNECKIGFTKQNVTSTSYDCKK